MITKRLYALILLLLSIVASGCAGYLSKDQCLSSDWYAQGFKDGRYGKPMTALAKEKKNCAKYGVSIETNKYQQGWDKGIQEYCTEDNAHQRGLTGQELTNDCPRALKQPYVQAWHQGLEQYCSAENGFKQGRTISAYPKICGDYHMTDFTVAYRMGLATHQEMKQIKQQIRKARRNSEAMRLTSSMNLTPAEQAEIAQLSLQIDELEREYGELQHKSY